MSQWRTIWRQAVAPQFADGQLRALLAALEAGPESGLVRGCTCLPKPLTRPGTDPVTACCPISYVGWKTEGRRTIEEAEAYLSLICERAAERLHAPSVWGCLSPFLNFWDHSDDDVWTLLAEEITDELHRRAS